jgi:hypothetical protein
MDVAATPAIRNAEVASTRAMIDRVENRFGMLAWMVGQKNIEPHVPVWEKGEREDGIFGRSDFEYDAETNSPTCHDGKRLVQFRRTYQTELAASPRLTPPLSRQQARLRRVP